MFHVDFVLKGLGGTHRGQRLLIILQRSSPKSPETMGPSLDLENILDIDTSSTAQGGGGSFKNTKPIREVGCCESRMAERSH